LHRGIQGSLEDSFIAVHNSFVEFAID